MDAERAAARIFDLVDSNHVSQAQGALETALQKYPNDDSVCAADAIVTMRSGNYPLARKKALALSTRNVTKPRAVNVLIHVLQNCCCWEALAATYERVKPLQNERSMTENLFQTYVRMGAYGKAQQIATQLYRQYNDPKYQVWMVQGMLAQVPADSTDHMLLKLSTKLLDAAVLTDKGHVVPSTVQMYVDVLAQQGQYAAAVDFLLSERSAKIGLLAARLEALTKMLCKAGRLGAANAVALHLWRMESDNWTSYTLYKDTLLPPTTGSGAEEATARQEETTVLEVCGPVPEMRATIDCATAHHSYEEALEVAHELQAAEEANHPNKHRRGPFLAELDLLHTLQSTDAMQVKVMAYVQRFYRKPSCYLDLSTFLTPAIAAEVSEWARTTAKDAEDELDGHTRRVLGLRCYVASWAAAPAAEEQDALFDECVQAYQNSKHLSESLAWSEEGLCDGYITVALNLALRGFAASPGTPSAYACLTRALDMMQTVDRRMSNPTWLIYSVCFAHLLGLTDCAALHQLAFKNVQRDTMAHVGYWPLLSGLALEDVGEWEGWVEDFYSRQERDCSLLRAKVFNYTSWPAMQDIQRFETLQLNSLYRWQYPANEYAAVLTECQTQKDVSDSFETRVEALWEAWERLQQSSDTLVDNTDWVVARSMVLGNIHSSQVQELTALLVPVPSKEWQLRRSRQILASTFLLHDMVAIQACQRAASQAGKPRKGGKGKGAASSGDAAAAATSQAAPELYTPRLEASKGETGNSVEYLPAVQPLAKVLRAFIDSHGAAAATPAAVAESVAELRQYLQALVSDASQPHSAGAFETFLYPQAYFISALLKMAPPKLLPVKQWATEMKEVLEAAQQRYEVPSWSTLATVVGQAAPLSPEACAIEVAPESFTAKLLEEKVRRIVGYVSSLKVEVGVHAR